MQPNKKTELQVKHWLKKAKEDLISAKIMLDGSRYTWAAFICQQALEKLLKAGYVKKKKEVPPYIHKLERLVELLELKIEDKEIIDWIIRIDKYYIATRYPSYKTSVNITNKKIAINLYNKCRGIFKWLQKELNLK